jgi:YD repeat-containing protein
MSGYSQNNANVATTNYAYDYANRLTSTTEPNSFATTNGYDELSRLTGAQGSGNSSATNTTYNNLGWVLQKVDADGVTDSKTYNADGCVTAETIGSKTTSPIAYNADNQLTAQTDADGNLLTNIYDQFGNLTEAKHTNGSTVLKDVQISPDSLGRPILQKDTATGISHSWTYPTNAATGIQETVNYDATPLTKVVISRDARNMENQRVAQIGTNNTVTTPTAGWLPPCSRPAAHSSARVAASTLPAASPASPVPATPRATQPPMPTTPTAACSPTRACRYCWAAR